MIQMGSMLLVADNSGAKIARCIKILGGSKKMVGKIGDKIIVSIKKTNILNKIKEGSVWKAVLVRTKSIYKRIDGTVIKFGNNSIILLDKENNMVGTRIFGCIPREIKKNNIDKIVSLAPEII
jgi:large subunit ribosomal protein L14